jgi:hypothetical protein
MSLSLRKSVLAVCMMFPVAGLAQTGAVLRNTVENFAEDNQFFDAQESYVTVTKVTGDRMRTDQQSMDGRLTTSAIFLGETDQMYMIDHDKKTYMVMDKAQIDAMAQQMSAAMQQMQEALAQVPPEQREMMERMMKGRMQTENYEPPAPQVVTDLGESGSVNGVACQWKQLTRDGQLESKVCVSDENAIAGGKEMVALAHEMREFAEGLTQMASSVSSMPMLGGGTAQDAWVGMTADVGGFAIVAEDYDGEGKLMRRSTFESADQVAIPDEEFNPPSGYERQTMEGLRR